MRSIVVPSSVLLLVVWVGAPSPLAAAADPHDQSEASLRAGFPSLTYLKSDVAIIAFSPTATKVIDTRRADLPASHPLFFEAGFEEDDILLIEAELAPSDRFYVVFSPGPSLDPSFYLIRLGASPDDLWAEVPGNALAIPGNGSLYTATRANSHFTKRLKYAYSPTGLREVPQPYLFVGLQTSALQPITLYASPAGGTVVAQLPAGSRLDVLLTDDREDELNRTCFLVKTPFGLLGWVWVPSTQYRSSIIEGISWWGD